MSDPASPTERVPDPLPSDPAPTAPGVEDGEPPGAGVSAGPAEAAAEVALPRRRRRAAPAAGPGEVVGAGRRGPTFVFFGAVAGLSLLADVITKAWALRVLSQRTAAEPGLVLIDRHLTLTLAFNRGGAWGILQDASEVVRRPFFLLVSVAAIVFIVSLYHRLHPSQRALTWGLPLVLGGALGNLTDRIVRNSVIDFIDYRGAGGQMNELIATRLSSGWTVTEHWPTFNVADVSICAGVALMAIDMMFSRRGPAPTARERVTVGEDDGATARAAADDEQRLALRGLPAGATAPPPSP